MLETLRRRIKEGFISVLRKRGSAFQAEEMAYTKVPCCNSI